MIETTIQWVNIEQEGSPRLKRESGYATEHFLLTVTHETWEEPSVIYASYIRTQVRGKWIERWEYLNRICPYQPTHWAFLPEPAKESSSKEFFPEREMYNGVPVEYLNRSSRVRMSNEKAAAGDPEEAKKVARRARAKARRLARKNTDTLPSPSAETQETSKESGSNDAQAMRELADELRLEHGQHAVTAEILDDTISVMGLTRKEADLLAQHFHL